MSIPGIFPIPPNNEARFDSASIRNVPDATTVSPRANPDRISTRSSVAVPTVTRRGTN